MSNSPTSNPKSAENHFFEQFTTLATAPDGIARLREMILQLAVQGKLGTQDAGDEPASVLLKKIRREKERLVKEGRIRNEKTLDSITETAIPCQIPKTWVWTCLREIGQIVGGSTPRTTNSEYYVKNGIPWITPADLYGLKKKYIGRGRRDISESGLKESSAQLLPKGTILFSSRAPIGYVAIASNSLSTNQGFKSCIPYVGEMSEFIYYFLVSSAKEIDAKASGTTFKEVSGQEVKRILFPLPPLAEQHRIVDKIDRLMALCDELEARQQQERVGCLELGTASLAGLQNAESPEEFGRQWAQVCDAFDLILDCPENVKVLRQTILQLAVQGRLVRQEPEDEPGSVLLGAIRKEKDRLVKDGKLQKEKPLKFVNGDNVPFKIPKEWLWTYFGQITFNRDGARIPIEKAERATRHGAYDYYGASGVIDTIDDYLFDKPLLLIGEDGANLVNRSTPIAFIAHGKYWVNNHAHVLDGISFEFLRYLEIYINSIDLRPYLTGMAQPKMNQAKMNSIPVPLPPLAEQHRIVEKVDALMALCDQLEAQMKERAGMQSKFTDTVVMKVGSG